MRPARWCSKRRRQNHRPDSGARSVGHSRGMSPIGSRREPSRGSDALHRGCASVSSSSFAECTADASSRHLLRAQEPRKPNLSRLDVDYRRSPRTVPSAAEAGPLSFHVRRPAIAKFDRALRECDILEMPAPTRVGLRARGNSANGDTRGPPSLRGTRRGDDLAVRQRSAKTLVDHGEGDDGMGDGPDGEPSHPAHIVVKATKVTRVARLIRDLP